MSNGNGIVQKVTELFDGLRSSNLVVGENSKPGDNVLDRLPKGTHVLQADWFSDALLGWAINPATRMCVAIYSGELCLDLCNKNLGMDASDAAEYMADGVVQAGGNAPILVWGLDSATS